MYFELPAGKKLDVDLLKEEIRTATARRFPIIVSQEPWNKTVKTDDVEDVVPQGYSIFIDGKVNAANAAIIEDVIAAHNPMVDYAEERKKSERQQRLKEFEKLLLKVLDDPTVAAAVKAKLG